MGSLICIQGVVSPPSILGILFVNSSPSAASALSSNTASSDLFDQSALSTLAQRLVEAARRAGPEAPDAVAGRGGAQGVEVLPRSVGGSEAAQGDHVRLRGLW